jgi:hypothetical protein
MIVDLKPGNFAHADAGQMNWYPDYAREHWAHPDENPPAGLIPGSETDTAVARCAPGNLAHQVLARTQSNEAEIARESTRRGGLLPVAPAGLEPLRDNGAALEPPLAVACQPLDS